MRFRFFASKNLVKTFNGLQKILLLNLQHHKVPVMEISIICETIL